MAKLCFLSWWCQAQSSQENFSYLPKCWRAYIFHSLHSFLVVMSRDTSGREKDCRYGQRNWNGLAWLFLKRTSRYTVRGELVKRKACALSKTKEWGCRRTLGCNVWRLWKQPSFEILFKPLEDEIWPFRLVFSLLVRARVILWIVEGSGIPSRVEQSSFGGMNKRFGRYTKAL